jgi:phosphoserine phosphatase RsbU/P
VLSMLQTRAAPVVKRVQTKLVLRESCGCALRGPRSEGATALAGESPGGAPAMTRCELWASAMRRVSPRSISLLHHTWAHDLALALDSDLSTDSGGRFLTGLASHVERVGEFDCVPDWHDVIHVLRANCVPSLREDADQWSRAESIFERAQRLVADAAERFQGQLRIEREGLLHVLNKVNRESRRLHDDQAVMSGLIAELPRIRVPRFYVARNRRAREHEDNCELLAAYDGENGTRTGSAVCYRASDIIPVHMQPASRHSIIVHRLLFGDDTLGFCAAEVGPLCGPVYESVCEALNFGFHNVSSLRKIVEEASRREQAERGRLEDELKLAQRIQCEILPKGRRVEGLEIATAMIPAAEVGGDYFDILPFDGGCWLGIGDVAGHGLDTGLIMLMIQSVVSATTLSLPNGSPHDVWTVVNAVLFENIRERLGRDEHATLSLLRYNVNGRIVFAGAHEDLIIWRAEGRFCETIPTRGIWAGILSKVADLSSDSGQLQLHPGDVLLLYTDGITEAMNDRREMFGVAQLCDALGQVSELPAESIREHLMARVFEWSSAITDDRTLVVARYHGPACVSIST